MKKCQAEIPHLSWIRILRNILSRWPFLKAFPKLTLNAHPLVLCKIQKKITALCPYHPIIWLEATLLFLIRSWCG